MSHTLTHASEFFNTARERYAIRERRLAGEPRPWTKDPIFQTWRFCNVHREHDVTTAWLREHITNPLAAKVSTPDYSPIGIVDAVIAFRWFNRIETAELIKDVLLSPIGWDSEVVRARLADVRPVVTGAYIIKGYDGYDKLNGVIKCIEEARARTTDIGLGWFRRDSCPTLEEAWRDLKTLNYMGGFMAYEVVSDLRWCVLTEAPDINTWANAGPGCARGLGWVVKGDWNMFTTSPSGQREMLPLMQELLAMSKNEEFWPQEWEPWEMREVEHWLCEFDKYNRALAGFRLKRRY